MRSENFEAVIFYGYYCTCIISGLVPLAYHYCSLRLEKYENELHPRDNLAVQRTTGVRVSIHDAKLSFNSCTRKGLQVCVRACVRASIHDAKLSFNSCSLEAIHVARLVSQ